MNELTVWTNPEFGEVRTTTIDGEPWFVGRDVAEILGYERGSKAVVDRVDEEDRRMIDAGTQSQLGIELGQRGGWLVNESGMYSLVLTSKLKTAKQFKRWITSEVLPSIRKTGSYSIQPKQPTSSLDILVQQNNVVAQAINVLKEHEERLNEMESAITDTQQQITDAVNVFTAPAFSPDEWQEKTRRAACDCAVAQGMNHAAFFDHIYHRVEEIAGVDLANRQTRKRNRLKAEGATKTQRNRVTILSIIAEDKALRPILDSILREEKAKVFISGRPVS